MSQQIIKFYTPTVWRLIWLGAMLPVVAYLFGWAGPHSLALTLHHTIGAVAWGLAVVYCLAKAWEN